jgi:3-methyladenine DNA glycosylase/8-oxoguanine DNA glycosylase
MEERSMSGLIPNKKQQQAILVAFHHRMFTEHRGHIQAYLWHQCNILDRSQ